jgi:sugar lactone lactonase YvrE
MKSRYLLMIAAGAVALVYAQDKVTPPSTGPGAQAPADSKEAEVLKTCKVPPPARGGGGRGPARGPAGAAASAAPKDYTVTEIPGVIKAGEKWTVVFEATGNNADGIIGTKDGGLLIAQNTNSDVVKLDKNGKATVAYPGLNTSGALSMNAKGTLYVNNRGMNASIQELAPKMRTFADKYNGESFDCIGGVLNDLTAAKNGGVYFTFGGLFYADPMGKVTKQGENLRTNGIILSRDEKTLYVTNGNTVAALDVQPDGSLKNQREFAKLEGGGNGDGTTIDSEGRLYVTTSAPGVQVIAADGKYLGMIPTPRDVISAAFSGKDKKTLYVVGWDAANLHDYVMSIPVESQGFKGRAK